MNRWHKLSVLLCVCLLSACSSVKPWLNQPMSADQALQAHVNETREPSLVMAVTISGGGARAAAFGYGVLRGLGDVHYTTASGREQSLLEATDLISGVSGGSIVSAYYAAYGKKGLPNFEDEFLHQNFQHDLISLLFKPGDAYKLTSPWFGRSNLLQQQLDDLYGGMTYGELEQRPRHPQLIVTATDLTRGNGFEFTWDQFRVICSDLNAVPLSFAVAASSSVPMALSPLTVKNYSSECPVDVHAFVEQEDPLSDLDFANYRQRIYRAQINEYLDSTVRPYIHLVDGGVSDNLGVQRLLDRALTSEGLRGTFRELEMPNHSVHKVVLIVVNAERDPEYNLDTSGKVPGMMQVADAMLFGTGALATHQTQEYLNDVVHSWKESARQGKRLDNSVFAPDAQIHVVTVNLRDAAAREDGSLMQVATAFSIPNDEIDELIRAGREGLYQSPDFKDLLQALDARIETPVSMPVLPGSDPALGQTVRPALPRVHDASLWLH